MASGFVFLSSLDGLTAIGLDKRIIYYVVLFWGAHASMHACMHVLFLTPSVLISLIGKLELLQLSLHYSDERNGKFEF